MPVALTLLGLWLLSGCIFIPIPEKTIHAVNVSAKVGGPSSVKPIRLRQTTRDDVITILGAAAQESPDGRRLTYTWSVYTGYWVGPLCAHPQGAGRAITLTFDEQGVLDSAEVPKEYHGPVN